MSVKLKKKNILRFLAKISFLVISESCVPPMEQE